MSFVAVAIPSSMMYLSPTHEAIETTGRDAQKPSLQKAAIFIIEFTAYAIFTICIIICSIEDRNAQDSHLMYRSTQQAIITPSHADFVAARTPYDALRYISDFIAAVVLMDFVAPNGHSLTNASNVDNFVLNSLTLMSTVRIRQLRVKTGCDLVGNTELLNLCVPPFSMDVLDTSPIVGKRSGKVYPYAPPDDSLSAQINGNVGSDVNYPLGGHQVEYDIETIRNALDRSVANGTGTITLEYIRNITYQFTSQWILDDWTNPTTRALFAEFSLMMNHGPRPTYGAAIVMFEFPPSGGCVATYQMVPFSPGTTITAAHLASIVSLCIVVLRRVVKIGVALNDSRKGRPCCPCLQWSHFDELVDQRWYSCQHCKARFDRLTYDKECPECERPVEHWSHICVRHNVFNVWTGMLTLQFVLLILCEVTTAAVRTDVSSMIAKFDQWLVEGGGASSNGNTTPPYVNFLPSQINSSNAVTMLAINVILASFGIFNYLAHFELFQKFLRLFSAGAYLLMAFTLTFSIPFVGFAVATHAIVGAYTEGFQTIQASIVMTFGILKGDIQLNDMNSETAWLLIVIYFVFGVLYVFIALNVFISIVSQSYEVALQHTPDDVYVNSIALFVAVVRSKVMPKESNAKHAHAASQSEKQNAWLMSQKRRQRSSRQRMMHGASTNSFFLPSHHASMVNVSDAARNTTQNVLEVGGISFEEENSTSQRPSILIEDEPKTT
eukprot:PhF_6_TR27120/c0_g1_i2/m.39521